MSFYAIFTLLWSSFISNVSNLCAVGWRWGRSADLAPQQDYFQPLRGWCSLVGSETASATGTYSASSLQWRQSSCHCSFLFSYSGVPLQTRPPRRSSSPVLHMREHERCRSTWAAFVKRPSTFLSCLKGFPNVCSRLGWSGSISLRGDGIIFRYSW